MGTLCTSASRWFSQRCWLLSLAVFLCLSANASAQIHPDIPATLEPWSAWALHGQAASSACAHSGEQALCVWPGRLQLDLNQQGGTFNYEVHLDAESVLHLPGSKTHWPQQVKIDNRPAVVLEHQGAPRLRTTAGRHRISGRFLWPQMPEALALPSTLALVNLKVNNQTVISPRRNPKLLWLSNTPDSKQEAPERVELQVFRHIKDGLPFTVHTLVKLRVSGSARELKLGALTPAGSQLVRLESKLPVRLDAQGGLSVQVYAGSHELSTHAVLPEPPQTLSAPKRPLPWPKQEIWVYTPNELLRLTELSGAPGIDPERTSLPLPWRKLGAYALAQGDTVTFKTLRRGEPEPAPNQLTLSRDLWLSLDGSRYTAQDRIGGRVTRDFRLNLEHGQLAHVSLSGEPQLITQSFDGERSGVELRHRDVNLVAEWETPTSDSLPAVAWSEEVNDLQIALHLPPGWQLLTAEGVDKISRTWFSRWDLFSVFFVLVVALTAARLVHPLCGGLALVTLALDHAEGDAPFAIWLVLIGLIALLRFLPAGGFRRFIATGAMVAGAALVVIVLGFCVEQFKEAIYPQTAQSGRIQSVAELAAPSVQEMAQDNVAESRANQSQVKNQKARPPSKLSGRSQPYEASAPASSWQAATNLARSKDKFDAPQAARQEADAVVQTGIGVPAWHWQTLNLSWSGPVKRDHQMHLRLLSPTGSAVLGFVRVLFTGLLSFFLLRLLVSQLFRAREENDNPPGGDSESRKKPSHKGVAAAVLLIACFATLAPVPAQAAEFPDEKLLKELRNRLTAPAKCSPHCLNVAALDLAIVGDQLAITAEVHTEALSAYQLPGPNKTWQPNEVLLNGENEPALRREVDGFLYLRMPQGRHLVTLRGPLTADELTLALGSQPRRVTANVAGWKVVGINQKGLAEGSVRLTKKQSSSLSKNRTKQESRPNTQSWLEVTRVLHLGVRWTIRTTVERFGATSGDTPPLITRYPLSVGEQVTQAGLQVEGNEAILSFARGMRSLSFDSTLAITPTLKLTAPKARPLSEHWYLRCEAQWTCSTSGIAPTSRLRDGQYHRRFDPWPGEAVSIKATKLAVSPGESLTITNSDLVVTPGVRMLRAALSLQARASRSALLPITLPEGSEITELRIGGQVKSARKDGNTVQVSIPPGDQVVSLRWQQSQGMTSLFRSPKVSLGRSASNVKVRIAMPASRWLLFAGGPAWGPAVLFWGYLLMVVLLSLLLGRIPRSPLSALQWLLLGIGLTQVPIFVAALIGSWFFVFAHLDRFRPKHAIWFNLSQLALCFFTLAFLGCLFGAVYDGLLSTPDMEVKGANSSTSQLNWFIDRSLDGALPEPWVLSTSLWGWRAAMLLWALWLASNLLKWLRFAWERFSADGFWKKIAPLASALHAGAAAAPPPDGEGTHPTANNREQAREANPKAKDSEK